MCMKFVHYVIFVCPRFADDLTVCISPFLGRFASCFTVVIELVIREEMHDANLPQKREMP